MKFGLHDPVTYLLAFTMHVSPSSILLSQYYVNTISGPVFKYNYRSIYFRGNTTYLSTGEMRWSSIIADNQNLTIHSWCPNDACQLIQQHGQPHHPDWTIEHNETDQQEPQQKQGVPRHQGAADSSSRPVTQIRRINYAYIKCPSAGYDTSYLTRPAPVPQGLVRATWGDEPSVEGQVLQFFCGVG